MSQTSAGIVFSKERVEMLSDGIFAIAMTLLVLELKVPAVPRYAPVSEVLHGMREEIPGYIGFILTFALGCQFWIQQHVMFHYVRHVMRWFALLTLLFLMFVSLLPYSTKMLTGMGLRQPVAQLWYFGNQWALAAVLAVKWLLAKRGGLLTGDPNDRDRRQFEIVILAQPVALLLPLVAAFRYPRQAFNGLALAFIASALLARRLSARQVAP